MPLRAWRRSPEGSGEPRRGFLLATLLLLLAVPATTGGFEAYFPGNEHLRRTIREVWERQSVRPPLGLEQQVRDALRSISAVEGRTAPQVAGLLATQLKAAWLELERTRSIGALGYSEFDEEKFQAAESKLQEVLTQFLGARTPSPVERYQPALQALSNVHALSRDARRAVPGLSSDDVLLMREKRQKLLLKEPRGEEGLPARFGIETAPSR